MNDEVRPAVPELHAPAARRKDIRRTWLAWGLLLIFSAAGWMRAADAWADREWLSRAGVEPGPAYLIASGVVWGVVGLAGALALLLHLRYGKRIALSAAFLIALTFWLDRILFNYAPGSGGNTLFALLATLVLLGIVVRALTAPQGWRLFRRK